MKQQDVALIIVAGFISAVFSIILANTIFNSSSKRQLTADKIIPITSEFVEPDSKYFNSQSIDPTQIIRIGDGENQTPFNGQ